MNVLNTILAPKYICLDTGILFGLENAVWRDCDFISVAFEKKLTGFAYDLRHFSFLYKVLSWTHKHMNLFDYTTV